MDLQLKNKKALVTGSTAGIGFAIASLLAQEGASVVVNGRSQERVEEAVQRIKKVKKDAQVTGVAADLGTKEGVDVLTRAVPALDILVNNLGIFEAKPFPEITDEDWLRFFEVNVLSGARLSRHLPAADAPEELGSHRLHLQRVGAEHPGRDDPLRRHQDGADRPGPWPGRDDRRDQRDGQLGAARPDPLGGRREVRAGHGEGPRRRRGGPWRRSSSARCVPPRC